MTLIYRTDSIYGTKNEKPSNCAFQFSYEKNRKHDDRNKK